MSRLLVTGATGFVGRHVLEHLEGDAREVHALSSRTQVDGRWVVWHRADILDTAATAKLVREIAPTHLLHLAWFAEPGAFWRSPSNLDWLAASALLVRAFREAGGRRIVTAGSCAEYDWSSGVCHESTSRCLPATLYGATKNALQEVTTAYARQEDFSSAWGRLFFMYGPGEPPAKLVASVIGSLLAGEDACCSDGAQLRDFMHVADVAAALVALLDSAVEGPVNIASGRPVAVRDLVREIAVQLGAGERLRFGALPSAAGEAPLIVGDTSRLHSEVRWAGTRGVAEGVAETIAWWRQQRAVRAQ